MRKNKKNKFNIKITSRTENLEVIRDFVKEIAKKFGFLEEDINKIELAVDEACTNVIKHAYKFDDKKKIDIRVETGGNAFTVIITDRGQGFDPENLPDVKDRIEKHLPHGLGIFLIKEMMDEVNFDIHPGKKNQLRMVKYLP